MPLKITKASDPIRVDRLTVCIYGAPGLGKTTLAFTADDPLVLDFDHGAHRAGNRRDIVPIRAWADVESITAADLADYKTIVLDTAGRALDSLAVDIIRKNPKAGNGGALSLKGYGELKTRFTAFSRLLNSFGKDLVMICHMDEQRNGDEVIERLDAQGGSKNEIYKSADAMGRIFVRGGKRYLDFSPREGSFGKNPGQLPELEMPHPSANPHFLGETIAQIKAKLNAMSDDQLKAQAETDEWAMAIRDLETVDEFNKQLEAIQRAPEPAKLLFNRAAREKGLHYNKTAKRYEEATVAA